MDTITCFEFAILMAMGFVGIYINILITLYVLKGLIALCDWFSKVKDWIWSWFGN